jgi:hypothetical protein
MTACPCCGKPPCPDCGRCPGAGHDPACASAAAQATRDRLASYDAPLAERAVGTPEPLLGRLLRRKR